MCRRLFIRVSEEDISIPGDLMTPPIKLVSINLESRPIWVGSDTENFNNKLKKRLILTALWHRLSHLRNQLVEIHATLSPEVIFLILVIIVEILARSCFYDKFCRAVDSIPQHLGIVSKFVSHTKVIYQRHRTRAISLA